MTLIDLPIRSGPTLPLGAIVEREQIGGTEYWTCTVFGIHRQPRRKWFTSRAEATAHAASVADEHGVPMFDNVDPGEPE